jgi:serine/threonine protein kinase
VETSNVRIGKFTVLRKLGKGGMGAVYEGHDPTLDRRVAIKTLNADVISEPESRGRFEREARAAAKLQHPNIVTIYELGNFGGKEKPYIVMEYLEGSDVNSLLGRDGLPLGEALDITIQLCRALDFAHQNGVVHRDVKPSNLRYLDSGQIKILDFGIAHVEGGAQITREGQMVGTLHYMSPEQIRGQDLDGRSDIFSAGCILYELLTGERPFPGDSPTSILYRIVHEEPEPVLSKKPGLPHEIQNLLTRALAKDRNGRFSSAAEMARELEKLLMVFKKTLPRPSGEIQQQLDELTAMSRDQRWRELVSASKQMLATNPELPEARRHLRRALRELQRGELARNETPESRTQQLAEIQAELTELYGVSSQTLKGMSLLSEPAPPSRQTTPPASLDRSWTSGPAPVTTSSGQSSSAIWAVAAPIWALVGVLFLGAIGVLGWLFFREPPGPVSVSHILRVTSEPAGASVYVNGEPSGVVTRVGGAELAVSGLPNERVVLELRLDGHEPVRRELTITEEEMAGVDVVLDPTTRFFELATVPAGASVQIDGDVLPDVTPVTIELSPDDDHEITVSLAEYQSRTLRIAAGESLPQEPIALTRLGRPGTLQVQASYPVSIQRRDRELAPISSNASVSLRPGRYDVQLVAPSVFLNRSYSVEIREDEVSVIAAPELGRLSVRANPGNCTLTIDGFDAGSPPFMNKEIAAGNHEFVFRWGSDEDVQNIVVESGKPTYVIGQRR